MTPLEPDQVDAFLRRFHRGRGGRLRAVAVTAARGGVSAVTFTLTARDAQADDAEVELRLRVGRVGELRLQVRPTEDPTELAEGVNVGRFQDQFFVDLQPWTDGPLGVHDYRASSCYAAGATLAWELAGPD
jgi:hypothetical protein